MVEVGPLLPATAALAEDGRLEIGGCVVADVVEQFGTPLLLVDETAIREQARQQLVALTAGRTAEGWQRQRDRPSRDG